MGIYKDPASFSASVYVYAHINASFKALGFKNKNNSMDKLKIRVHSISNTMFLNVILLSKIR